MIDTRLELLLLRTVVLQVSSSPTYYLGSTFNTLDEFSEFGNDGHTPSSSFGESGEIFKPLLNKSTAGNAYR